MGRHRILELAVAALVAGLCLWVVAAVFELPLADALVVAGVAALLFLGALLPRWAREAGQHEAEARRDQYHRRPLSRRRT